MTHFSRSVNNRIDRLTLSRHDHGLRASNGEQETRSLHKTSSPRNVETPVAGRSPACAHLYRKPSEDGPSCEWPRSACKRRSRLASPSICIASGCGRMNSIGFDGGKWTPVRQLPQSEGRCGMEMGPASRATSLSMFGPLMARPTPTRSFETHTFATPSSSLPKSPPGRDGMQPFVWRRTGVANGAPDRDGRSCQRPRLSLGRQEPLRLFHGDLHRHTGDVDDFFSLSQFAPKLAPPLEKIPNLLHITVSHRQRHHPRRKRAVHRTAAFRRRQQPNLRAVGGEAVMVLGQQLGLHGLVLKTALEEQRSGAAPVVMLGQW